MTTSDRPDSPDPAQTEAEHDAARDAERVAGRAQLLPEEQRAGSDDPARQAEIILEDSEARTEVPNAAPATHLERRTSEEAT